MRRALLGAWVTTAALCLLACGATDKGRPSPADGDSEALSEVEEEAPAPFRLVVISDTHLMTTNAADDNKRFLAAGTLFSQAEPPNDFAVATGDNVDDLFCIPGVTCTEPPKILGLYRQLIADAFTIPFYVVLGNHDDRYFDTFTDTKAPLHSWELAFAASPAYPGPYYEVIHKGFSFVMLNSTDLAFDHASNDLPSFGAEQLAWLSETLERGRPTVLFWHHFLRPAEVGAENQALLDLLRRHKATIKAVFAGHEHAWEHVVWEGIDFYETANMGKNTELPYYLVLCDPTTGAVTATRHDDPDPLAP